MKRVKLMALLAAVALLSLAAAAGCENGGDKSSDIEIVDPFARAAIDRGAVFFTVENRGDGDDALVGASSDVAGKVELHETVMEDDTAKMQPVTEIETPAGEETILEPGGLHVMLTDLKEELKKGDTFRLTLDFEKADSQELEVTVREYSEEPMNGTDGDSGNGMDGVSDNGMNGN
jgi:copper(I)-binding protein